MLVAWSVPFVCKFDTEDELACDTFRRCRPEIQEIVMDKGLEP